MNFLKKNSARQGLCRFRQMKKHLKIRHWFVWTCAGVLLFLVLGTLAWRRLPEYYTRFYLTRSVLQTRGRLLDLWGKDPQGEGGDEDSVKLVADEVKWNGHSVLVLPGGFGISWKEQRNEENTFAQGSLDVYFLGAIRDGVHYWADKENAVISVPEITKTSVRTSQEALKEVMGFTIVPGDRNRMNDRLEVLKKEAIQMANQSQIKFMKRDKNGVTIEMSVPSGVFDAFLTEVGDILEDGSGKDIKEWGQMIKERKAPGETQEILFTIDKQLHITEVQAEGLADMSLLLEPHEGLRLDGKVWLRDRELGVASRVYFGNGKEGNRSFQIPELNITYYNGKFRLGLELSGGYEGGKVSPEVLDYGKLSGTGGGSADGGLQDVKDKFLKRAGQLGLDIDK